MRKLLILLVLLCSSAGAVEPIAVSPDGNMIVTLSKDRCGDKVTELLRAMGAPEVGIQKLQAATVSFEGKQLEACYIQQGDEVFLVDEDGDQGRVPVSAFKLRQIL